MNKFKVGDRIRNIETGRIDVVKLLPGMEEYDRCRYIGSESGMVTDGSLWTHQEDWELISKRGRPTKEKEVMFIATYDVNDVDPHKTFTSRKELTDWLREAKEDTSIRFSSIKVYEVKKELEVITSFKLKYVKK